MATQQAKLSTALLQCYNCKEISWSEIFHCTKGHEICNECYPKITNCPECKIKLAPTNKIQVSKLAKHIFDSMEFDCPYKEHGCEEKLTRMKLPTHREKCTYRFGSFQLCKKIGFQCDYSVCKFETSKVLQHFQEVHAFPLNYSKDVTISMKNVLSADDLQSQTAVWTPVIVKLGEEDNAPVFLIVGVGKDKMIQLRLWFLGEPTAAVNYRGEFEISGMHSPSLTSKLCWTEDPCGIWCEEDYRRTTSSKIPVQLLKQHSSLSSTNPTIIIKATITDIVNDTGIVEGATVTCPVVEIDRHVQESVSHLEPTDPIENFPTNYVCEKCKASPIRDIFYASLITKFYVLCGLCASKEFDKEKVYAIVTSHRHEKILRGLASTDEGWTPVIKDKIIYRVQPLECRSKWEDESHTPIKNIKEITCKGCPAGLGFPKNEKSLYLPLHSVEFYHFRPEETGQFELYPTGKGVHKSGCNSELYEGFCYHDCVDDDECNESDDGEDNGSNENGGSEQELSVVPYVKPDDGFDYTYTCLECKDYFICTKCVFAGVHWETGHMLAMLPHKKHIFYFKLDGGRNLRRLISFINKTISDNDA